MVFGPCAETPTHSVHADERVSKKAKITKRESSQKRRSRTSSQHNAHSPRSIGKFKTPAIATEGGAIAELERGPVHVGDELNIGGAALPFDNAGPDVPGAEDDYDGCTLSENPGISSVGLEKERRVAASSRPPPPVTPPIWAQVRRLICR